MAIDGGIREQALDWAVRSGDPAFSEWEAFTLWLEADPAHARAYDEVCAATADAVELMAAAPANDDAVHDQTRSGQTRRRLIGSAAAAIALLVGVWAFNGQTQRDLYIVQTTPGETTRVTLDADTHVELAGGTAVTFDRKDRRFARLEHGQALFTVHHDAAHPFEVTVGKERLIDIGTVFDVRRDDDGLSVAVSEGAVQYDPAGADVRVSPGEVLRRPAGSVDYTLTKMPVEQVGEWREGRLTFENASLQDVAAQLKRATGIDYVAQDQGGTISGSILVAPLRKDPASVGPLLGVSARAQGARWVIGAR